MIKRERIPDLIIDRAVELWCRKLLEPVFDNGDDSVHGGMSHALAMTRILRDKSDINNINDRIEVFRKLLSERIKSMRDGAEYLNPWLDVDYNPCEELARAADHAGIPHSQFSCKSSVYMRMDYVSTSFGYGVDDTYHYPLPDGGWLLTTLQGPDIDKMIKQIMSGNFMGLTVEGADGALLEKT